MELIAFSFLSFMAQVFTTFQRDVDKTKFFLD